MTLSPIWRRALEVLSDGKDHGGANFGIAVYGDTKKNGGSRKPQGAGRMGGGLLAALRRAGLVDLSRDDGSNHSNYRITRRGREALHDHQEVKK